MDIFITNLVQNAQFHESNSPLENAPAAIVNNETPAARIVETPIVASNEVPSANIDEMPAMIVDEMPAAIVDRTSAVTVSIYICVKPR